MNNADVPAMPIANHDLTVAIGNGDNKFGGLTKREMMAMHFMAAWIQHHGSLNNNYRFNQKDAAICAIECADALLREL